MSRTGRQVGLRRYMRSKRGFKRYARRTKGLNYAPRGGFAL